MTASVASNQALRESVSQTWWLVLIWGIASVILGLMLLFSPGITAVILVQFMAAFWLVGGIIDVFGSIRHRDKPGWGWKLAGAILGIIGGILVLTNPMMGTWIAVSFLFYMLAFGAIFNGLVNMFFGNRVRSGGGTDWSWGSFLLGLLQLIIGFYLLWHPFAGTFALVPVIGILVIVFGIGEIILSFRVKGLAKA